MAADVLSYLFEIDAKLDALTALDGKLSAIEGKLDAATAATSHFERATGHLDRASGHASSSMDHHAHSAMNVGHAIEEATEAMHSMGEALGAMAIFEVFEMGYELAERFVDKIMEIGGEMIKVAAKAEKTSFSFKLLFGEEEGEELVDWLDKVSVHLGYTGQETKDLAANLARVGIHGEQLKRSLAAALDMAALPGGDAMGAIDAIARLKRTGHVDNRVLGPLAVGENDFLSQLSKRTGQSMATIKKKLEKGKLDTSEALEALNDLIVKKTGKDLGGAGVAVGGLMDSKIKHFHEIPEKMFEALEKSPAFGKLTEFVDKMTKLFAPEGPLGEKLGASLEKVFSKFVDVITKVDLEKMFSGMADAIGSLPELIGATTEAMTKLLPIAIKVATGIMEVITMSNKHNGAAQANPFMYTGGMRAAEDSGKGLAAGIDKVEAKIKAAGEGLGKSALAGAKDSLEIHSPSRAFERLGKLTSEGYVRGVDGGSREVDSAFSRSFTPDGMRAGNFSPAPTSARGAGGGVTVNVGGISIEMSSGDKDHHGEMAAELAAKIEESLVAKLSSVFEGLSMEAGVS